MGDRAMIHPHVSTLGPVPTAPGCRDGKGQRCADPATTWIVAPDDHVISAMCDRHADAVLGEYAAKAGDVPELAGWYGVPVQVASDPAPVGMYYTPPAILEIIEPQIGSGMFLVEAAP